MSSFRVALLLVLGLSLGAVTLACSDDDSDSPETSGSLDAYFAGLGDIGNDFLDSIVIGPEGLDPSAPISDQVDVYETYLSGVSADIEDARNDLEDIEPPEELADAHAGLLAAVENALSVAEDIEAEIGDINSSEDLAALAGNPDIGTALAQFTTACTALKDIAADNNINREVRCE
jgi:hypothetical protein